MIRTTLSLCGTTLAGAFAVHELLSDEDEPSATCSAEEMLLNEAVGQDIRCSDKGVWEKILEEGNGQGRRGWSVSAGPLEHRGESTCFERTAIRSRP